MKKILFVFGTRPEAIKICPLVLEMKKSKILSPVVCVTGQHREMLDDILRLFKLYPDYDLDIMEPGQTLIDITTRVTKKLDRVIRKVDPDLIVVHGDTSSSFSSAVTAFYNKVPIAHVEAGLRSNNMYSPFPEEFNRKLIGAFASLNFTPTEHNRNNLLRENCNERSIFVTGNTVIDALQLFVDDKYEFEGELQKIDFEKEKVILVTCHRRENLGTNMQEIFSAIKDVAAAHPEVTVVFPMHKNPKIRAIANDYLQGDSQIRLIEPLTYLPFVNLMAKSYLILTDSGGIQEEAPSLNTPVLVLRTETERPEGVDCGAVKVVGVNKQKIIQLTTRLLSDEDFYKEISSHTNPYGDGNASKRIVGHIEEYFNAES